MNGSQRCHVTHVNFSSRGDRLVACYHADHAYCFDVTSAGHLSVTYNTPAAIAAAVAATTGTLADAGVGFRAPRNGYGAHHTSGSSSSSNHCSNSSSRHGEQRLPEAAERAKLEFNEAVFLQRYPRAVSCATAAITAAPWAPWLYSQRALALLKRGWEGDAAFALRDCDTALALVEQQQGGGGPGGVMAAQQARLRRVHALKAMAQHQVRRGGGVEGAVRGGGGKEKGGQESGWWYAATSGGGGGVGGSEWCGGTRKVEGHDTTSGEMCLWGRGENGEDGDIGLSVRVPEEVHMFGKRLVGREMGWGRSEYVWVCGDDGLGGLLGFGCEVQYLGQSR